MIEVVCLEEQKIAKTFNIHLGCLCNSSWGHFSFIWGAFVWVAGRL